MKRFAPIVMETGKGLKGSKLAMFVQGQERWTVRNAMGQEKYVVQVVMDLERKTADGVPVRESLYAQHARQKHGMLQSPSANKLNRLIKNVIVSLSLE